jgi:hypothetical protein
MCVTEQCKFDGTDLMVGCPESNDRTGIMAAITSREELAEVIASVEVERQAAARESGNAAACIVALRKLQELQTHEKEALTAHGPSAVHSANLATLGAEIGRVQKLAGTTNHRLSVPNKARSEEANGTRPDSTRAPVRNRGRKTMGRSGR